MRKVVMVILIMTLLANTVTLLDISILREIIVFIFLSFVPGFAILKLFKLKATSHLDTILFSVGLSIAFVMFMGLLVNELYLFLGLSQPLSTIPLMAAISVPTLAIFFIEYRRDLSETLRLETIFKGKLKDVFPLSIILVLLPLLSAIGVFYLNVSVIILSYTIIAALCVMSVVSRRLFPENLFPFLIFSISIALVCQVPLTSKYVVGWDADLESYVFRLTQIRGHWGFLAANSDLLTTLTYNSMLSITLLPAVYSSMTGAQGEAVFKILYPFISCLVPLTMYQIFERQFGKFIGFLSVLFFVFSPTAFFGPGALGLNRQIVGELFLLLSVFLLLNRTIAVVKRRWLLIIFGAALAVSHYALAYFYLAIVTLYFIVSRVKPGFDETLNTVTVFSLFGVTFLWYTLGSSAPLISLTSFINSIRLTFVELTSGLLPSQAIAVQTAALPEVFTTSSWINLALLGITNLFLIIGILLIILRPKRTGIFAQYRLVVIVGGIVLAASYVAPTFAEVLEFGRFVAITMLFLSPCFVLGGQALLVTTKKAWTKIKRPPKRQIAPKDKNVNQMFLLIAIILSAYFLSEVGFVNRVTGGALHYYTIDLDRLKTSNDNQVKIGFYAAYIPEQDAFSATWLSNHRAETATVFADDESGSHVLLSYGLVPRKLLLPITNNTIPPQGSIVYLGSLNTVDGVITTTNAGSFNTSEISSLLDQNNLIYSNGNSEIWYIVPAP